MIGKYSLIRLKDQQENLRNLLDLEYSKAPVHQDKELIGYCKGALEYLPQLIVLTKLWTDQQRYSLPEATLFEENADLTEKLKTLEKQLLEDDFLNQSCVDIKDTHYVKPDPRLVFED